LLGPPPDCLAPAHTGRLRVTGSTFVGVGTGVDPSNLVDSTVSVVRNDFVNVDLSVFGEDDYGSRIVIKGNDIDAPTRPVPFTPTGILILNGCSGPNPRQALSRLTIQNNDILMTEDMTGLVAADCAHGDGADPTLNVRVLGNHFESNNGFAGVDIPFGEDGRVAGNRFSGTAFGGIGLVVNNSGFDIVNNDFTDFETDGPDILLGPETTRNRVVINEGDVVDDQGTDNIIIVR
ncbi:MAG: right-handed parallel beta-helix repeat-containing protein, partial [Acidimicrobiia bacterium]|nr:right-handed parallel beta-helix repeat-containing protein [Acidimicrobiia bacterium]